jgi:hypothetical protein
MRPQDIEKIANSVVGAFTGPTQASAGCGAISSAESYECATGFTCGLVGYECGGQATFSCAPTATFTCLSFNCPSSFDCTSAYGT